jgi:hypothetical protein
MAEYNTIVTFVGMLCAVVPAMTGFYAGYVRKRTALLKTNNVLRRAHLTFGDFATALYALGLFAGVTGLVGALTHGKPPLELDSLSFNIHTWGSFPALIFVLWKLYHSYFDKRALYGKRKWLGIAMFLSWTFTWLTAAVTYYQRTLPSNPQHPPPSVLLPYDWMLLQLALPYLLGGLIGAFLIRRATSSAAPAA